VRTVDPVSSYPASEQERTPLAVAWTARASARNRPTAARSRKGPGCL